MSRGGIVYVVDDDPSVRDSLRRLITSVGHRVRTYETADAFLCCDRPAVPACLVLDVRMPGTSGLELQERLAEREPRLPVVFITGHGDVAMSVQAMKRGAVDFLTKPFRDQELLDAIRVALARSREALEAANERQEVLNRMSLLTPREREVFRLVVTGMPNRQIGVRLGTAEKTIKTHRSRMMRKLGAWSLADLVRFASKLEPGP